MKEKYIPSPGEIKRAEEMMTNEEVKKSKERASTYRAGGEGKQEYIFKLEMEKFADEHKLTGEIREIFLKNKFGYTIGDKHFAPGNESLTPELILDFIKRVPLVTIYNPYRKDLLNSAIIEALVDRFPQVLIYGADERQHSEIEDARYRRWGIE